MSNKVAGKRVAILVANGFEQVEFTEPKKALESAGAETVVVSLKPGKINGFNHHDKADAFDVEMTVADALEEDFDALLIPGGVLSPDELRGDQNALAFTRSFFDDGKPVFAICHGPQVLISAEVVEGRTMTCYQTVRIDLENAGARFKDQSVVTDKGLVTSRNPNDIPDFNRKIVEELAEGRHTGARSGNRAQPGATSAL